MPGERVANNWRGFYDISGACRLIICIAGAGCFYSFLSRLCILVLTKLQALEYCWIISGVCVLIDEAQGLNGRFSLWDQCRTSGKIRKQRY